MLVVCIHACIHSSKIYMLSREKKGSLCGFVRFTEISRRGTDDITILMFFELCRRFFSKQPDLEKRNFRNNHHISYTNLFFILNLNMSIR